MKHYIQICYKDLHGLLWHGKNDSISLTKFEKKKKIWTSEKYKVKNTTF